MRPRPCRPARNSQMRLGVPALLGLSSWRGLDLLVTARCPAGSGGWASAASCRTSRLLREISELSPAHVGELAASPWWLSVRSRIQTGVGDPESHSALAAGAERIEAAHGGRRWSSAPGTVIWCHGTSPGGAPACTHGTGRAARPTRRSGFDAVHFHYSVAFIARRRPLAEAVAIAAAVRARP